MRGGLVREDSISKLSISVCLSRSQDKSKNIVHLNFFGEHSNRPDEQAQIKLGPMAEDTENTLTNPLTSCWQYLQVRPNGRGPDKKEDRFF
jgi:hypothetical protein